MNKFLIVFFAGIVTLSSLSMEQESAKKLLFLGAKVGNYNTSKEALLIELSAIVTDHQLHHIARSELCVIFQGEYELSLMDPALKEEHTKSGLLEKAKQSKMGIFEAEKYMDQFLNAHFKSDERILAFCNSKDARIVSFAMKYMHKRLGSIRSMGWVSIKELEEYWGTRAYCPSDQPTAQKNAEEVIKEFQCYKEKYFDQKSSTNQKQEGK